MIDESNWILDAANPFVQYGGSGPNSELRMSEWKVDSITIPIEGAAQGNVSDWQTIQSSNLNYTIQYKVYIPVNYDNLATLPVIYVTDGQEYSDERLGSMINVINNLIHQKRIKPIVAVFVDPRNPDNLSENRRMEEYRSNIKFVNFLADELKPTINKAYKVNSSPRSTAIIGTSLGGWNSTFTAFERNDAFQLIGIHSPAYHDQKLFSMVEDSEKLPLKLFMGTGVIYDTEVYARRMKGILERKGYEFQYIEVNEGHSWGNWRALLDEPLIYFFGS